MGVRPKPVHKACVHCKRAHLACDAERPCRRCLGSGRATTCVDVVHKKRGRPRSQKSITPGAAQPGPPFFLCGCPRVEKWVRDAPPHTHTHRRAHTGFARGRPGRSVDNPLGALPGRTSPVERGSTKTHRAGARAGAGLGHLHANLRQRFERGQHVAQRHVLCPVCAGHGRAADRAGPARRSANYALLEHQHDLHRLGRRGR